MLGEIAFILAASSLARALEVARPHLTALALYAIPMTWACGAYFGQTDVWGSALLLASASALIAYRRRGALRWLAAGLFALMLALLAKQLTWFAAPALIALAIAGIARHRDRRAYAIAIASPLVLFVVDPFLTLPDGFRSHVAFVIARGSGHGELAVASGASLWSLFVPGGTPAAQLRWLGVSSFAWGWILWAAIILISAIAIARRPSDRHLVLGAGLAQLAMATLLTGVHERYLVHAVPLVLVASRERRLRILGVVVGIVSGVFVLSTLHDLPAALARPEPLALLALAWLAATLAVLVTVRAGTEPRSR